MKRDMELIRQIAFKVESAAHGISKPVGSEQIDVDGYTKEQIGYHVDLMVESGMLRAISTTHLGSAYPEYLINQLTSAGHDFVDAARSDTVWNKTITQAKETGISLTVELATQLLKSTAKSMLGIS